HIYTTNSYNFVSNLHFYNSPTNKNSKMTIKGYVDILDSWLSHGLRPRRTVLKEDRDSGFGTRALNIVRTWKKNHGLELYFNRHDSPDLALIQNCWQPPK
ncbi:hypothetical protein K432DRAFT_285622, partial [Lepidopterella palustris CBS 459.81]